MFDPSAYTTLRQNAAALAAAREDTALATGQQLCDALREVQVGIDMLEGVRADLLARLETSDGYAEEGASTTSSWARKELRMGLGESRKNCRAGQTLQLLPAVAQALAEGRIRAAHVYEFTAGVTKLGADVMADLEDILLPVAESNDPSEVKAAISALHEILHPDELDKQYARGMERKDFKATPCGEGYHVTGFLDILTGAKVSAWLKDVSGPEYEGDDRTPGQRRVDALARLIDQAVTLMSDQAPSTGSTDQPGVSGDASEGGDASKTGETTDTGATPQPAGAQQQRPRRDTRLLVLADLETLLRRPGAEPATLAGFGHIGEQLLGYLLRLRRHRHPHRRTLRRCDATSRRTQRRPYPQTRHSRTARCDPRPSRRHLRRTRLRPDLSRVPPRRVVGARYRTHRSGQLGRNL